MKKLISAGWVGNCYNGDTGFASICPITSIAKGWGYEILLPKGLVFQGVILTDQLKNLDWSARSLQIKGQAPKSIVQDFLDKIHTFL